MEQRPFICSARNNYEYKRHRCLFTTTTHYYTLATLSVLVILPASSGILHVCPSHCSRYSCSSSSLGRCTIPSSSSRCWKSSLFWSWVQKVRVVIRHSLPLTLSMLTATRPLPPCFSHEQWIQAILRKMHHRVSFWARPTQTPSQVLAAFPALPPSTTN